MRRDEVVTERWGRHYWSCTWCAAIQARRHETGGNLPPATEAEVRALAHQGGDPDLEDGSTVTHLERGVLRRYGRRWRHQAMDRSTFLRLARTPGVGLILGVNAGRMPAAIRRYYGRFTGGHRTFVACYGDRDLLRRPLVTVLDPMMPRGSRGVRVRPEELWGAVWPDQLIVVHAPRDL
jgi:hypothetical protein